MQTEADCSRRHIQFTRFSNFIISLSIDTKTNGIPVPVWAKHRTLPGITFYLFLIYCVVKNVLHFIYTHNSDYN